MEAKRQIVCPYCANQGIKMMATLQRSEAKQEGHVRYGCGNEHYWAVPIESVQERNAA